MARPDAPTEQVQALEQLRTAFAGMYFRVRFLVDRIHDDCKGLTVHDISHLDALWEMADLLVGSNIEFTPTEIFVLGGSILLHDAGMTTVAFPGGRAELEITSQWRDNVSAMRRARNSGSYHTISTDDLDEKAKKELTF